MSLLMSNMQRTCGECQRVESVADQRSNDSIRRYAAEHGLCLSCGRWRELVGHRHMNASVRVNGQHYWIGEEPSASALKSNPDYFGYGGRLFRIEFIDQDQRVREDLVVYSHNLNHQGKIPTHFATRLPDNARLDMVASGEV